MVISWKRWKITKLMLLQENCSRVPGSRKWWYNQSNSTIFEDLQEHSSVSKFKKNTVACTVLQHLRRLQLTGHRVVPVQRTAIAKLIVQKRIRLLCVPRTPYLGSVLDATGVRDVFGFHALCLYIRLIVETNRRVWYPAICAQVHGCRRGREEAISWRWRAWQYH